MMIYFIDNIVHQKTKSMDFFLEFFQEDSKKIFYDTSWKNQLGTEQPDVIFFWQEFPDFKDLKFLKKYNVIFIPMWDDCKKLTSSQWWELKDFKFISFSRALDSKLYSLGLDFFSIQFFPELLKSEKQNRKKDLISIFFWQRTKEVNLELLSKILPKKIKFRIIFRNDTKDDKTPIPNKTWEFDKIDWFETKEELWEKILECDYFMAPRLFEGIGHSFIEALSLGVPVLAPNNSTMNEYIENGKNGFVWDPRNPRCIEEISSADLRSSTIEISMKMRKKFLDKISPMKEYISLNSPKIKKKHIFLTLIVLGKKLKRKIFYG